MADIKTKQTELSVDVYLNAITDVQRQADCRIIIDLMRKITGDEPKIWGDSLIGFGNTRLKYASGREVDWFKTGFSNRKDAISIYSMYGFISQPELMQKLGKVKMGKGCLYIKRIADIDLNILEQLLVNYLQSMSARKECNPG